MLRGDNQIVGLRYEHLDHVHAVAQVVLARVQRLLFYYFVDELLILHLFIVACVALNFLCVKGARRRAPFLFPYYEVWALHVVYERILANIL